MDFDFDSVPDRLHSDCIKWQYYSEDVTPLWIADLDFPAPPPVIDALRRRVDHGVFGYGCEPDHLRELLVERMERLYGWRIQPADIVFVPGIVTGFNVAARAFVPPGSGMLLQTPIYPPMLDVAANFGIQQHEMELTRGADGRYSIDRDAFQAAIRPDTRMFLLCNPHNPAGRTFTPAELEAMGEQCLRSDVVVCSDEIHCDLVFSNGRHVPFASLAPEFAARSVTLMAPSKTFNIAGLGCSFAIIQDAELRKRYQAARKDIVSQVNILAFTAAEAAYEEGGPWLDSLIRYLEGNRDYLAQFVAAELPGIRMGVPEATYLAWLDCRDSSIEGSPYRFFLDKAKVALNDGRLFGRGGAGFVRLNFGCPRATLAGALSRMKQAYGETRSN